MRVLLQGMEQLATNHFGRVLYSMLRYKGREFLVSSSRRSIMKIVKIILFKRITLLPEDNWESVFTNYNNWN